ncbi:hypothetical protein LWC34_30090 [Kibdelosporangium philippinense]|uniref:Tetratricopeptide repeat protein n=1 Tax=Kibdelosporangium philippinense TaxID=211113 RepID=A0ABS8ZGW9_9PSEU|nr:hypothetical protein [Kibdelosporangium philippinense]MCE7007049.1 hypothetical protein [Kibdelosporangium philippinense]
MAGVNGALSSGLPDDVRQLLAVPPVTEKKLLELGVAWPGLSPSQARMADALRLFVMTWDPLEWRPRRPDGLATANAVPSDLELVVYAPVWSLVEVAGEREVTMADVLGSMAGSAVVTAAAHEQSVISGEYPDLVTRQAIPDLLSDLAAGFALGPVAVRLVSAGWEDIGLGAITDVVQHAFGAVDLDRSLVELAVAAELRLGCPACAGRRFHFPAELAEAQDGMCPAHQREAARVISTRLARANASNPDGWGALADASRRLEQPHLPNGLATKLAGADEAMYVVTEPGELAIRAEHVVRAAGWFPGRPDELAVALGQEPGPMAQLPDWLVNLVLDLGRAGLGIEAAMVGDALARVDPDDTAFYHGMAAVALAEAGLAEEARARIEAGLARWPDDFWIRMHAGDALAALGDLDGAEAHFSTALGMAEQADDVDTRYDALQRLTRIGRRTSQDERCQRGGQRRQPRRKLSKSQRKRKR